MENAIQLLKDQFGTEFGADAVRSVASELNTTYATLSKKISQYKVSRGKWNLEVTQEKVEELEKDYASPAVEGVSTIQFVKQNLIPEKDDTFVSFGNFSDIKKLLTPVYSILHSLQVFLVMVKHSVLSKRVLNSDEN